MVAELSLMGKRIRVRLVLVLCCLIKGSHAVIWSVLTDRVVFGYNVTLMCESNNSSCNNCLKRWYKGENYHLLSIGTVSSDNKKYKATLNSGNLYLTIYNITQDDLNIKYRCAHGFDHYDDYLIFSSTYIHRDDNVDSSKDTAILIPLSSAVSGMVVVFIFILVVAYLCLRKQKKNNRLYKNKDTQDQSSAEPMVTNVEDVIQNIPITN